MKMKFVDAKIARRQLLASAMLVLQVPPLARHMPFVAPPAAATDVGGAVAAARLLVPPAAALDGGGTAAAARLLSAIPEMAFGAPATNATIPAATVADIEAQAVALERLGAKDLARDASLDGGWRLLYSNAREITNLAAGLPLGFALGKTYQPVDLATGRFENQGLVEHVLGVARASTCVVGDLRLAPAGTLNAAGTVNDAGNRVDVDFRRITFGLDELLGRPSTLRKVLRPRARRTRAPTVSACRSFSSDSAPVGFIWLIPSNVRCR